MAQISTKLFPRGPITGDLVGPWEDLVRALESAGIDEQRLKGLQPYIRAAKQQAIMLNQKIEALANRIIQTINQTNINTTNVTVIQNQSGTLVDHDHTSIPGDGGVLTNDEHDGFIEIQESIEPPTPVGNKLRIYAEDVAGITYLYAKDDAGTIYQIIPNTGGGSTYHLQILGPGVSVAPGTTWTPITLPAMFTGNENDNEILVFRWDAGNTGVDAEYRLWDRTNSLALLSGSRAAPFAEVIQTNIAAASNVPASQAEIELQVRFSAVGTGGSIELTWPGLWRAA